MRRRCLAWTSRFGALNLCGITLAAVFVAQAALACTHDAGWQEMTAESHNSGEASIRLPVDNVPLNQPFEIEVSVCPADGAPIERFTLDAIMPAHQHGMNYQPVILKSGDGAFLADGLVFHMPGIWRISVSALVGGETHGYFLDLKIR